MTASGSAILLIDGSGYIFRAFFALPHLSSPDGVPTNAVYGVATMLDKTLRELQPAAVAVCFDRPEKTFRHERYPAYKANRPAPPEALVPQFPLIHRLVELRGLPLLAIPGYEADDIIGTVARRAVAEGCEVVIVTGDKDLMQLVSSRVRLYDPMKDEWIDAAKVKERFGVGPEQVVEVLALAGDKSDNIPGIPGVGEKTAAKLLAEFGTLENVLMQTENIKGKLGEKVRDNADLARLSLELVPINRDVPLARDWRELHPVEPDPQKLRAFYQELGFTKLLAELAPRVTVSRDNYRTILRDRELLDLVERLRTSAGFAFDTETDSTQPMQARLVGMSFCCADDAAVYLPLAHHYLGAPEQIAQARALAMLKPVLEDAKIPKWGQNAKYDLTVMSRHGVQVRGLVGDTMIADYLLNPGFGGHSLDAMAAQHLGHTTIKFDQVVGGKTGRQTFADVPLNEAAAYAAEDAHITWLLAQRLEEQLRNDERMWSLYRDLELPLIDVLGAMERAGVSIDVAFFAELADELDAKINELIREIHELAGEPFNLNSPQQIGRILFEKLGIKPLRKTKTGFSTDAAVLETLAEQGHAVPVKMLEYRTLAKIKGTYVDALPRLINPATGRIHTSFNQTIAATGRLSSSDPNLQNIPIRTPEGRRIRRGFVPAPGKRLLSADYSQIELRLAAHLSGDPTMIAAFHSGEDFHTRTAAEIMGVFPNLVTPEMRSAAKTVNFGVLYGMSSFRLGRDLGIGTKKAQEFLDRFFGRFAVLHQWLDDVLVRARETGYVATILGRRRYLPDLNSNDQNVRGGAERAAINTPVQGSAADLIKLAMLRLHRRILDERLPMTMVLQVHDELVFEVERSAVDRCTAIVKQEMESIMSLAVPLLVETGVGDNWMEAH